MTCACLRVPQHGRAPLSQLGITQATNGMGRLAYVTRGIAMQSLDVKVTGLSWSPLLEDTGMTEAKVAVELHRLRGEVAELERQLEGQQKALAPMGNDRCLRIFRDIYRWHGPLPVLRHQV